MEKEKDIKKGVESSSAKEKAAVKSTKSSSVKNPSKKDADIVKTADKKTEVKDEVKKETVVKKEVSTSVKKSDSSMVSSNFDLVESIKEIGNYLTMLLKNPMDGIEDKSSKKLEDIKFSGLLFIIVVFISSFIGFISSLINIVYSDEKIMVSDGSMSNFVWERLEYYNLFEFFADNLIIYSGIILAISVVYFVGAIIIKKTLDFPKTLGIVSAVLAPSYVMALIVVPILSKISIYCGVFAMFIAMFYPVLILVKYFSDKLKLNNSQYVFVNLICISLILLITGYILKTVLVSALTSSIVGSLGTYGF